MAESDKSTAVFGAFDGATSALGFVLSLALFGSLHALVVATVSGGVAAGASMAAGEWLSDQSGSKRRALVMGLATLVGSISPAIPFFVLHGMWAFVGCAAIVCVLGVVIARLRPTPQPLSYLQTFGVLLIATGLAVLAGWLA